MVEEPLKETARIYRVLDLEVDLARESVRRGEDEIDMPDLSFRLLATLIRHSPDTISKDELVREVWGEVIVSDETLSQRVRLLRQALGEDAQNPRYLSSVRGRGYKLICAIQALSDTEQSAPGNGSRQASAWIAGVLITALLAYLFWPAPTDRQSKQIVADVRSIAVLPFADLSPDGDYRYFADGMQEELLTRLAKLDDLRIASRTSVEQYRNTELTVPQIARELSVGAVIESSVRVAGERVRITVQLIDASSDSHIWANNYERALSVENLFAIQHEVAQQIGEALAKEFRTVEQTDPLQLPTSSLEAYNAYLIGRSLTFASTPGDLNVAIQSLQEAVTIDPEFAEAWAALGQAYSFVGTIYGQQPPKEVFPKAKDAVVRALTIDGQLTAARSLYADILTWYDWDFDAAEREYQKVRSEDPDNVLGYGLLLSLLERHAEAKSLIEEFINANPESDWGHINAAWIYFRARDYLLAIEQASLAPQHTDSSKVLGFSHLALGNRQQAVDIFETNLREQGRHPRQLSNLAVAYFTAGRDKDARELLQELETLSQSQFVSPGLLAEVYFAAIKPDEGFAALEQAVAGRSREAIFIKTDTVMDAYREDQRYLDLVEQIGF